MPISPLAAMMMTGGGNDASMMAMDPALIAAQPEMQLGQQMEQTGTSVAPTYPGAALARMLQAAIGAGLQRGAVSDLGNAYAGASNSMARIFPPNSPLGQMANDPNPIVRMWAMQQAPKAALLNQEAYTLRPDQVRQVYGTTVGTGSPTLGGAAAAQEAAAKAPYEPGGDMVANTPNGPQQVPITAATRAGLPYNHGAGATPTAAIPPPQTQPINPQRAPAPQMPMPPSPTGKDQSQVPQPAGLQGPPLANPAIEPAVAEDTKEVATDRQGALAAQKTMATARLVQDLLPKVQEGWGAETKLQAINILKGLGVPDDAVKAFTNTDLASGQVLTKNFLALSMGAMRGDFGGSREAFGAMQMFKNAYPSIGTDPDAADLMANVTRLDGVRGNNLANAKTSYLNDSINGVQSTGKYRGLNGFNEQFQKTDPPEFYVHAAEAMSKPKFSPWQRITDPNQQQQVINLIPSGSKFTAPDGKMYIKP